jgi:hypothetical protein
MPNPRTPQTNPDAGNTGWKLHLVDLDSLYQSHPKAPIYGSSLCGLKARFGWGLDLFVEDICARCAARASKLGIKLPDI